jgi:transcriptional regulator with XRE-family HTH domain
MGKKAAVLLPSTLSILADMGERIRMARLRRNLSVELVAERADISRATLWSIEKGSPSVAIGSYVQALLAIGLEKDLMLIAKDDILGQKLLDAQLPQRRRAKKRKKDE